MPIATYQDVAVALGRPITSSEQQAQIDWWITGIEMVVAGKLGDLAALDPETLKYVVVEAVAAKVRRGNNTESSITVSVDDGSVTRRYENAVTAGDISDEWWNLLRPATERGAFTITPGRSADGSRGCW